MSEPIWHHPPDIAALKRVHANDMNGHIGAEITEAGPDWLRGTMPVDHRTIQPAGVLHGGASVVLAETLGSVAAQHCVDPEAFIVMGQEVNANHLRAVRSGLVTGTAKAIHVGRTSQVWGIEIRNEAGQLTCIARLTVAVVPRR